VICWYRAWSERHVHLRLAKHAGKIDCELIRAIIFEFRNPKLDFDLGALANSPREAYGGRLAKMTAKYRIKIPSNVPAPPARYGADHYDGDIGRFRRCSQQAQILLPPETNQLGAFDQLAAVGAGGLFRLPVRNIEHAELDRNVAPARIEQHETTPLGDQSGSTETNCPSAMNGAPSCQAIVRFPSHQGRAQRQVELFTFSDPVTSTSIFCSAASNFIGDRFRHQSSSI